MNKPILSLAATSLMLLPAIALSCLPARAQSAPGYQLSQLSGQGPLQMRCSQMGLRLDLQNITIILQPDTGSGVVMNRRKRTWCQKTDRSLLNDYHSRYACGQLKPGGSTTMNGYPAKQWFGQAYDAQTHKPAWMLEMFTTQSLNVPKRIQDDCAEMMGVPKGFGWPLRVVHYFNYGTPQQKQELVLQTSDIRTVTTSAADFAPMPGFTLVKDGAEVLTGTSQKDLDDILKEIEGPAPKSR